MIIKDVGRTVWVVTIALMIIGLVALYSASHDNVRVSQKVFYDQLMGACLGLGIMFALSRLDYHKFYDFAYLFYTLSIVFLLVVLVSGRYVLGAKRWIELGSFNFQPSEFVKFSVILVLARYLSQIRRSYTFSSRNTIQILWREMMTPLILIGIPMLLIFKQPDLGTSLLIFGIFLVMIFTNGVSYKYLSGFLGLCFAVMPLAWHVMKDYQRQRLMVFLNPNIDPLGAGYTIIQSKIAVGSGGLFGKGWLSGTQNQLNFLPERHTDFIFSVIGEEWGFIGTIFLLFCFFILIRCALTIAQQTKDGFGSMLAVGIVASITLQVIVNMGMVIGLCPVVGITLPLISYGRSSFLTFVVLIGILLNLNERRTLF